MNQTASSDAFERFKTSMDSEISKVILGQTLTTEVGDKGTQALGTVHKSVMESFISADKTLVKSFFEDVAWIYGQLNDATADSPVFEWEQEEDEKNSLATRDKTLADTGMVRFTKAYFMRKYNFEEGDIDEVQKQEPPPIDPNGNPGNPNKENNQPMANFAETGFPDQDALDKFMTSIPAGAMQGLAEDALKPVITGIMEGKDFEQVMEHLAKVYPDMDSARLEEVLARAIFVAEVWGRLNAAKGK
jgi:phage gp29-like protein